MPQRIRSSHNPESEPDEGKGGPEEAAAYITAALIDLSAISRRHGFCTLGYLLDMAQLEAHDILHFRHKPKT